MPDGEIVTSTNVNNSSQFYSENDSEQKVFFQFDNPPLGDWAIIADNMNEDIKVDIIGADLSSALIIDSLELHEGAATIPYNAYSSTSEAVLSIYYDDDNAGFNGIKITDVGINNKNEVLSWNITDIPNGNYFIYGILDDGKNSPVRVYSPNALTVTKDNTPDRPTSLQYTIENDTLRLTWDYNANANVSFNVYYNNLLNFDNTTKSYNAGSQKYILLPELVSGRDYYFAVTAINEQNLESEYSEALKVTYQKQNVNNPPFITNIDIASLVYVDSLFVGQVYAHDSDEGDKLTFSLQGEPEGVSINDVGRIEWIPDVNHIGLNTFKVMVSDKEKATDSSLVTITVKQNLIEMPELVANKDIYTSFCDLPVINLTDGMLRTNESVKDSVRVRISNGEQAVERILYEQSLNSKMFSNKIDIAELEYELNINDEDTIVVSYKNHSYGTSDTVRLIIDNRFNINLLNMEGDYVLGAGENMSISAASGFSVYEWYKNDEEEPLSYEKDYLITSGGKYYVKVEDEYGCVASSNLVSVTITGVNDILDDNNVSVHYKQDIRSVVIKIDNGAKLPYQLEIYNALGQLVIKKNIENTEDRINMAEFSTGSYNVVVINKEERKATRIIKH
jgi:hypothetical protein